MQGHNSTAALLEEGGITGCVSEERFNRKKNSDKFPTNAINFLLTGAKVEGGSNDIDLYVHAAYNAPAIFKYNKGNRKIFTVDNIFNKLIDTLYYKYPFCRHLLKQSYLYLPARRWKSTNFNNKVKEYILRSLPSGKNKLTFVDHHTCHAYAVYYGFVPYRLRKEKFLILTLDGEGDGLCATVNAVSDGSWERISQTKAGASLAGFYGALTQHMGMKIDEHEYKVMGLAPYASSYYTNKVLKKLKGLYWINDDLSFGSIGGYRYIRKYLSNELKNSRFDGLAGAAQKFVEDLVCEWVSRIMAKTNIYNIALSGGFFMNVKANKSIMELPGINDLIVCPSAGDESVPIGAAYYGMKVLGYDIDKNSLPINNIYLGPQYNEVEIAKSIKETSASIKYNIYKPDEVELEIANILTKNKIVACFSGRMEFGARALGNRSILANPSNIAVIKEINEQIKNRDFWMPFACTILAEREKDYLINPKNISSPYMSLAFDTTPRARTELIAGLHPYDYTVRPQVLQEKDNPRYYRIIKEFEKRTNIGGILNTSFNLHGEPIVCTPHDAISTFERSGLEYLALGPFILEK